MTMTVRVDRRSLVEMPIATSRFLHNCNATLLVDASREARMSHHTYT